MSQLPFLPDLIISDTHLGHTKITEYCLRDNGLAPTPDAVDEMIVASWNMAVARFEEKNNREPVILHCGDVGRMRSPDRRSQDPLLIALRGDKYTFRGNHDHWKEDWIEEQGFQLVEPFTFRHDGFRVVVTHYPLRSAPDDVVNVHGHTHNNPFNSASRHHRNVSVETVGYTPRPFLKIVNSSIRLLTEVPDHIDYNATEAQAALANVLELEPRHA